MAESSMKSSEVEVSDLDSIARSPQVEILIDSDGNLLDEIECRHCGYNLRGLALEGKCPECMTVVG